MKDKNGKRITEGCIVYRRNLNGGWATLATKIPLVVVKAPVDSNRKYDLYNPETGEREHFTESQEWQDMSARGIVLYGYEIVGRIDKTGLNIIKELLKNKIGKL